MNHNLLLNLPTNFPACHAPHGHRLDLQLHDHSLWEAWLYVWSGVPDSVVVQVVSPPPFATSSEICFGPHDKPYDNKRDVEREKQWKTCVAKQAIYESTFMMKDLQRSRGQQRAGRDQNKECANAGLNNVTGVVALLPGCSTKDDLQRGSSDILGLQPSCIMLRQRNKCLYPIIRVTCLQLQASVQRRQMP